MATNQRLSSGFHNPVTLPYRLAAKPATILPAWVELSALPSGLEDQIPAVRGYKYVKLQDKVLRVLS
jgi:hypothetical protein